MLQLCLVQNGKGDKRKMNEKEQQFNQWFDQYANGVKVFEEADMKQAYLQGRAELEKENEWHKADVPTSPINKVVLGYIKDYNSKKFCLVKWNGEWWYDARTWNDKVKLIAWKEIVLPKEIE